MVCCNSRRTRHGAVSGVCFVLAALADVPLVSIAQRQEMLLVDVFNCPQVESTFSLRPTPTPVILAIIACLSTRVSLPSRSPRAWFPHPSLAQPVAHSQHV